MVALVGIGLLAPVTAALALASVAFTAALAGWRFHRRAGGITGDFLGATQQLSEIALLLILLAGG
jgi:adenosylcobinamide-GDP ribazoletransferase